jgi:hypothetical protein
MRDEERLGGETVRQIEGKGIGKGLQGKTKEILFYDFRARGWWLL